MGWTYADRVGQLHRRHVSFLGLGRRRASEEVEGGAGREQALVLLPFQSLAQERQQTGRRHHRHLARQSCAPIERTHW